ncbi:hypothetical protein DMN91_010858 [Ooceraea biroi]|uniref:Carboxylic ester hydrolase n=1 Tax=Ooceraea biroi TaxID=2015173 RepID=A0A026WIS7_OOCBI|nr:Esterase FE4 [Ooceraea biroi]RLU16790.1 hypothetical protein DMN91_010858 [Ooceraea biroi]
MDKKRVEVRVREGRLSGTVEEAVFGDPYIAFRGIPYAKPPVGELRFKDPLPSKPWSGVRDASKHGNIPIQRDPITRELIGDEDCLFLNVYTKNIKPCQKRATMVWIYGGGYTMGSGDMSFYGPDYIIQWDVVLVTLNYRLGVLGFLNLDNEVAPGNQGMKDVVMALKWVQRNISKFGGDPGNVTIFGESAGGAITHFLSVSPLTKGLFHKAISQSGVAINPWAFNEWTSEVNTGLLFAEKLGKVTTDPKIACEFLKSIDAKELIKTEQIFLSENKNLAIAFAPSPDSDMPNPFFPKRLKNYVDCGVQVPFLLGFNSCEGSFLVSSNTFGNLSKNTIQQIDSDFKRAILSKVLPTLPLIPITVQELRSLYFGDKAVSEETLDIYADFLGDQYFCRGIMKIADIQVNRGNSCKATYLYKFSYDSDESFMKKVMNIQIPGAPHAAELFYLFCPHIMKELGMPLFERDSKEYMMMKCFTRMWTDFAKTGNPTPAVTDLTPVKWTPLKKGNVYDYLNIDTQTRMEIFHKGQQRWDWENVRHKL